MFVLCHEVAARLPRADGHDERPDDAVGHGPNRVAHAVRVEIVRAAGPGEDAGHGVAVGERFDAAEPAAARADEKRHCDERGREKDEEHDRIRQQHARRAGIDREGGERQPHDHSAQAVVIARDAAHERGHALNGTEQVCAHGHEQNDGREPAQALRAEAAAEILRQRRHLAPADVPAEEPGAVDIARRLNDADGHDADEKAGVDLACVAEKGACREKRRDERPDDQQRRRVAAGDVVVVRIFDHAPCADADGEEHDERGQNSQEIQIHFFCPSPRFGPVTAR